MMKILAKLLMGFLAVALLCVTVGIVSIMQIGSLGKSIDTMTERTIPTIQLLYQINNQMYAIKVAIRSIANPLGKDDDAYIKRQKDNITAARNQYAELIDTFEKLPKVPEEQKLWDEVKLDMPIVKVYNDKILSLADRAVATANPADRTRLYNELYGMTAGDQRLVFDDFLGKMQKIIDYDASYYGKQIPEAAQKAAELGRAVVWIVLALSVAIAVILGFWLGSSISRSLKQAVRILDKLAAGDLSERMKVKTKDEFLQLSSSVNTCIDNINGLAVEVNSLVDAALEGKLSVRADATKHQGDYRKVIEGVNETLDAVITPLNMAASYVEQIAKGAIPSKITDSYSGDFNLIKNNLNLCIDSINALVADTVNLVQAAVEGRLSTRAEAGRHQGDYRKIVEGVNQTLDLVITPINEMTGVLKHLADGDLTVEMAGDYKGDFDILKSALNASLASFNEILSQVATAVEQVNAGSLQVSQASQALSQGATEQASSLEEITSSITEVSGQTRLNTENVVQVNGLAKTARQSAEQGNVQMRDLVAAMSDINKSAEEIRKIVKTIDDISFQINLLALNANVEAARAGKYGKGFGVVAEEVRNLAVRSANSVKETTRMVDEVIANIGRGNGLVDVTAKQLADIVDGSAKVANLAEEVSVASKEQALGLEQITTGLGQIDQVTQSNTASAEESAAAAEELTSQAQQLRATLGRFRIRAAEGKVSNAEVIQLLKAELAKQSGSRPSAAGGRPEASRPEAAAAKPARKTAITNPAELISLDDDNFGKF
jgi:methyl-accepting chemotaxis protein